jgi:hypothetical protein
MKSASDCGNTDCNHLLTSNPLLDDYDEHRPTDEQVSMQGTLGHHLDSHGSNVEDIAGTGEVDSLGG